MLITRLKGGPLDRGVLSLQDSTQWVFVELAKPGVDLSTIEKKIPYMQTAEWPGDDEPVGRPPGFTGPMVCYRFLNVNRGIGKAEFEYDPEYSDDIVVEYDIENPKS